MVSWASRSFYYELLKAGVKIYQFNKGLLHTKSVLVDGQLSLLGTINLDMRSLWLNCEITLVIDNKKFGNKLYCIQKHYINQSKLITLKSWLNRPFWHRVLERSLYFFSPIL